MPQELFTLLPVRESREYDVSAVNHDFEYLSILWCLDDPRLKGKENKQSYKELLEGSLTEPAGLSTQKADQLSTPKRQKHKKTRALTRWLMIII